MRFSTAVIWNGIAQFGQSGVTLLSTIILARLLSPDDFAIIGIVTIFIAFSQMMVDSEMGGALLRKKTVTKTDYSTLFYYNLAVSLLLYAVLYFVAPLIADFYNKPLLTGVVRVISLTIIIHAFRVVQKIMIFRDLKFKIFAVINIASGLLSLGLAIWMAKRGYGYWALVWQQIALAVFNVIFMEAYNRFIPSLTFSKASFKYQFSFGISLLGSDTVQTIANNISTNIIAKLASMQITAFYTHTSRITNFCQTSLGSLMNQSIFPLMAKFESVKEVRRVYYRILKLLCVALILVTILFIIFGYQIVTKVLGSQYAGAVEFFQILSLTILPTTVQVLCRNILKTLGSTKRVLYLETLKSVIVILLLLGGALIDTDWVVWSLVISQSISCVIWLWDTEKDLQRKIDNNQGLPNV